MLIQYKCCFCLKTYDWYDGLYENPNYDSQKKRIADKNGESYPEKPGVFVNTNAITLCCVEPVDDNIHNPNPLSAKPVDGNGDVYINLCPACMRKILDNTHLIDENTDAWGCI